MLTLSNEDYHQKTVTKHWSAPDFKRDSRDTDVTIALGNMTYNLSKSLYKNEIKKFLQNEDVISEAKVKW